MAVWNKGAQRLSASKELSPCVSGCLLRSLTCSTPFGIKGTLTPARWRKCRGCPVLNAFRHQRNSHWIPDAVLAVGNRAQRLSASKELSRRPAGKSLSACLRVLNAFRHQRNSHCASNRLRKKPIGAQRLSASKELSRNARFGKSRIDGCSTPFGIKGTLTTKPIY